MFIIRTFVQMNLEMEVTAEGRRLYMALFEAERSYYLGYPVDEEEVRATIEAANSPYIFWPFTRCKHTVKPPNIYRSAFSQGKVAIIKWRRFHFRCGGGGEEGNIFNRRTICSLCTLHVLRNEFDILYRLD